MLKTISNFVYATAIGSDVTLFAPNPRRHSLVLQAGRGNGAVWKLGSAISAYPLGMRVPTSGRAIQLTRHRNGAGIQMSVHYMNNGLGADGGGLEFIYLPGERGTFVERPSDLSTRFNIDTFASTVTSQQVLPPNPNRVGLILTPHNAVSVTYRIGQAVGGVAQGLYVSPTTAPVELDVWEHGTGIQESIHALCSGAGSTVSITEIVTD